MVLSTTVEITELYETVHQTYRLTAMPPLAKIFFNSTKNVIFMQFTDLLILKSPQKINSFT